MASINIQNIKSNTQYLQTLLTEHDIICIQEHWLFNYEQNWINNSINDIKVFMKSVDDEDPVSHAQKVRGYGGVAIVSNNTLLNDNIKQLPDGNTRIQVLELKSDGTKFLIVNCYMPCRNSKTGITDYDDALDTLGEILTKYSDTHNILLAGDFNASLTRQPENQHDKKLKRFIKEHNIHTSTNTNTPTFYHHNGKDHAQIDYIFYLPTNTEAEKTHTFHTQIHPVHPINTSDHTVITAKISLYTNISRETNTNKESNKPEPTFQKPRWTKCDTLLYKNTVENLLKDANINTNTESNTLLGLEISKLETILQHATELSIEGHKTHASKTKTRGRGKWNCEIAEASQQSKAIHKKIKESGNAGKELIEQQKEAKKKLRRLQRQQAHSDRETLYKEIMDAEKEDQQLFYKLVNKQRKTKSHTTSTIILEGNELATNEEILGGWKLHFQKLATPDDQNNNTDTDLEDQVNMNDLLIQQLNSTINEPIMPITHEEVQGAIKQLKKNKAPDAYGITAEHIQLAQVGLIPIITSLVNKTIELGSLPQHLKEGVLTPVLKKGKDQKIPSNYRGITVTTIFSKILEHALQTRLNNILDATQSKLQRGFTAKTSPLNAAFLVSEAIAEHADLSNPMALVTLDAEKAFDRVWHERLFLKLYNDGVQGKLWLLLRDLQANGSTKVKWNCSLSSQFQTLQGIRQGAKLSTTLYKRYNNPLLKQIEEHNLGTTIGTTNVGAPTVADDISMLPSTPVDTKIMLHTVVNNAKLDKVNFNPSKSDVVIYNKPNIETSEWEIGKDKIQSSRNTTHLGLLREDTNKYNIQPKIQMARRTMYSLMGAGLHGRRGLNPLTSYKIWESFGLPRATYGLESVKLAKKRHRRLGEIPTWAAETNPVTAG